VTDGIVEIPRGSRRFVTPTVWAVFEGNSDTAFFNKKRGLIKNQRHGCLVTGQSRQALSAKKGENYGIQK